jgi:hypothetical protein
MVIGFANKGKAEEERKEKQIHFVNKVIALDAFHHVSIAKGCNVFVESNTEGQLTYRNKLDEVEILPEYQTKNDTLYILSTKNNLNNWVRIKVGTIQSVSIQNGKLTIDDFKQDELFIQADGTYIKVNENSSISFVDLVLKNSAELKAYKYKGSSVKLNIENSKIYITSNKRMESIYGIASGRSELRFSKANKINVETDNSTEMKIY